MNVKYVKFTVVQVAGGDLIPPCESAGEHLWGVAMLGVYLLALFLSLWKVSEHIHCM